RDPLAAPAGLVTPGRYPWTWPPALLGQVHRQQEQQHGQRDQDQWHPQPTGVVVNMCTCGLADRAITFRHGSSARRADEIFAAHAGPLWPASRPGSLRRCWVLMTSFPLD